MKRTALSCSLLLAFAVAALAAAPDAHGGKTVPRYVSGAMDGRFTFEVDSQEQVTTSGDVTGTLRHLGLSQMHTTHVPDFLTGALLDGTFTIVAANGDEISGRYTGYAVWNDDHTAVLGTADLMIEAGTGRFARAKGTINASFLETFDDPTWASAQVAWVLAGTVDY